MSLIVMFMVNSGLSSCRMVLMPLLSRLLTLLVILTMPLFLARLTLIPIKAAWRSEERFSRNAETDLVCRLLLEKKKNNQEAKLRDYEHDRAQVVKRQLGKTPARHGKDEQ